ncbi:MAG: hypothetical protein IPK13_09505 [Deltaproteobacteria bacterium]|nr:hypothetical protein [Deltaproteobacteria bacterium]
MRSWIICSLMERCGGAITNNIVVVDHKDIDTGIAAWASCCVIIAHNTVFMTDQRRRYSSIEWRGSGTDALVINNLANYVMRARDEARATLISNIDYADATWFDDPENLDLHLEASAVDAIDQGTVVDLEAHRKLRFREEDVVVHTVGHRSYKAQVGFRERPNHRPHIHGGVGDVDRSIRPWD